MTKQAKITLSASRDIPFNKLMLSQSNVRHVKAGVSIEELAEDIARRTLLSSITVRPVLDESGAETGMYTIPAGGRRFRALELLVKQKRMNKTALVPCIVRTDGLAEEDSLAENVQRAPLHPLDQFRAFHAMREKGRTEEEIAAAFFLSASVVKQRLKLAAVAPSLLDAYAEEEMTLDQLMAFTVNPDHARQEQVWEALQELGADVAGAAYVTATITVWDENARTAEAKLKAAEKIVQGRDFTCILESLNALEAWLGSLPGHLYANVRQPPISTLNLAHMIPISAVWAGPDRNDHLDGPPLFHAETDGKTPFRFSTHVGDVGHTLIVGPTGAGKSVLLALMALQFRR
nr:ParB/Srx family N-terminal domain-containing protein [Thetidibacter halocola]